MTVRSVLLVALAAALVAAALTPTAAGDHCRTKLTAYGRASTTPTPSPPYSSTTAGVCLAVYGQGIDDHLLPPNTDQVMVRVNGDFGPSIKSILIELDGLGFADHTFLANRTASPYGGYAYSFAEWIYLPEGPQSGDLHVTAYYPGLTVTEVYTTASVATPSA